MAAEENQYTLLQAQQWKKPQHIMLENDTGQIDTHTAVTV